MCEFKAVVIGWDGAVERTPAANSHSLIGAGMHGEAFSGEYNPELGRGSAWLVPTGFVDASAYQRARPWRAHHGSGAPTPDIQSRWEFWCSKMDDWFAGRNLDRLDERDWDLRMALADYDPHLLDPLPRECHQDIRLVTLHRPIQIPFEGTLSLVAPHCSEVRAPRLQVVGGGVWAGRDKPPTMPALWGCREFRYDGAGDLFLPNLTRAQAIDAPLARSVVVPRLGGACDIYAPCAAVVVVGERWTGQKPSRAPVAICHVWEQLRIVRRLGLEPEVIRVAGQYADDEARLREAVRGAIWAASGAAHREVLVHVVEPMIPQAEEKP